jgi:hypothetical protein
MFEHDSSEARQWTENEMCRLSGRHRAVFYCGTIGCQHCPSGRGAGAKR